MTDLGLGLTAHMRVVQKEIAARRIIEVAVIVGRLRERDVNEVVKFKGKMTRTTVILPHNDSISRVQSHR